MFSVELLQTAIADLEDAYDWYEQQSEGLGDRFIKELEDQLETISKNPNLFAIQFSGKYRFALLKHFPFRVVYHILEQEKYVYVTAIFHTSRNPKRF
jgi:plasmid stabilization system protein ParE